MRDPATYRSNRRGRAKELMKESAAAGTEVKLPQAWRAVTDVFRRRKNWRAAPRLSPPSEQNQ